MGKHTGGVLRGTARVMSHASGVLIVELDAETPTGDHMMHERIAELYMPKDRARMALLNDICLKKGRCQFCGRTLADETLAKTPGCCSAVKCKRLARIAELDRLYGRKP